ncbi:hypothetical protein CPB85DRAFT_1435341 [Mucidula mucida]|nr:hypothetical protein CPB85DRAFT_1435341 [Mucidula mucida]
MFARLSAIVVGALALTSVVVAVPTGDTEGVCPTGQTNECCNQYDTVGNLLAAGGLTPAVLAVLVGLPLNAVVGLGCVPVLLGGTCTQQNVCCPDNQSSSLVFLGCNNVNV